jgi:hypothetical protein
LLGSIKEALMLNCGITTTKRIKNMMNQNQMKICPISPAGCRRESESIFIGDFSFKPAAKILILPHPAATVPSRRHHAFGC